MTKTHLFLWSTIFITHWLISTLETQQIVKKSSANRIADLHFQYWLRGIEKRFKRSYRNEGVILNETGKCVINAETSSKHCAFDQVIEPPIDPEKAGKCEFSEQGSRELCMPRYEMLDTSCTDVGRGGMVAPPSIPFASVRQMAFVPSRNLAGLIRAYYRNKGQSVPKDYNPMNNAFLFITFKCQIGYELADQIDKMYCSNGNWIDTEPLCQGIGNCKVNNGGCSHTCQSQDEGVKCKCPRGMVLDSDEKTCIRPIPKNLCRSLAACSCTNIDDHQYICTCANGAKCLLLKGPPKLYITPEGPYQVQPGGSIDITCGAVAFPFPIIYWKREIEELRRKDTKPGTVRTQQVLVIRDLYRTTEFTCHSNNIHGETSRTVTVTVTGPGSDPKIRAISGRRTEIDLHWDPPEIVNRPVDSYTVYYAENRNDPVSSWQQLIIDEPGRRATIPNLEPSTRYFIRIRANDILGPGKLGRLLSVLTKKPGPTEPERVRSTVDGNSVLLNWATPKIANAPLVGYELFYSADGSLPTDRWSRVDVDDPTANSWQIDHLDEMTEYHFQIRAINELGPGLFSGKLTAITWLSVRLPDVSLNKGPVITLKPSKDQFPIECTGNGVPRPRLIWFFNGIPIEDGSNGWRIYDITPLDSLESTESRLIGRNSTVSGTIACQAVNSEGDMTKQVDIVILGPGSAPEDVHVTTKDDGFDVNWKPPSVPNGQITTYKIYYSTDEDEQMDSWKTTDVTGDLRNVTITVDDEDTDHFVRVQAVTDDGPGIVSDVFEVTTGKKRIAVMVKLVIKKPPIDELSTDSQVDPGETIDFECLSEGRPTPTVTLAWIHPDNRDYHHPEELHSHSRTTRTYTTGILVCEGRNVDGFADDRHKFIVTKPGNAPSDIELIVDPDNQITLSWKDPTLPNGVISIFTAYLSSDSNVPLDEWQRFEIPAEFTTSLARTERIFNRGDLEPSTDYFLVLSATGDGGEGPRSQMTPFRTVSGAPADSPSDILIDVKEDNSVEISGIGPQEPIGPIKTHTIYFTNDPFMTDGNFHQWEAIEVPTAGDSFTYTMDPEKLGLKPDSSYRLRVTATNDQSEGPASDVIEFDTGKGEYLPILTLDRDETVISVVPFGSLSVTCTAEGIPEPDVVWLVGADRRPQSVPSQVLELSNIVKDTIVECVGNNSQGETVKPVEILVSGPGSAPSEIVMLPQPNELINVEWTTPEFPNGNISHYIVHYAQLNPGVATPDDLHWTTVEVAGDVDTLSLDGLQPKTSYGVKVQAVSSRGPGVVSAMKVVKTLPKTPDRPSNLDVEIELDNSITVTFPVIYSPEHPDPVSIKDYVVYYTNEDPLPEDLTDWEESIWTQSNDDPEISIPIDGVNFEPDTNYTVKILARGEIDGTPSHPVVFRTGSGVLEPIDPTFDVDAPEGKIFVPPGTNFTVTCASYGIPKPTIKWFYQDGQVISEMATMKIVDIRRTTKTKCVAENHMGKKEIDLEIVITGPGTAPTEIQISSNSPRCVSVHWQPPDTPNGPITSYIVYYTPLDDQETISGHPQSSDDHHPSLPFTDWHTHHLTVSTNDSVHFKATLTDSIDPDTWYAVVVQATNDDGPGPYSDPLAVRTWSRGRDRPPQEFSIIANGQHSLNLSWEPPPDSSPNGYRIYYLQTDGRFDENELYTPIDHWMSIDILDPSQVGHHIKDVLEPDTEYAVKMQAIFNDGPGAFTLPCIMRTLPEGRPPYIAVPGDEGVLGRTDLFILPGSAIDIYCNTSGDPRPTVKWIKGGDFAIEPSKMKTDGYSKWSLFVANLTAKTSFHCIAENPLGTANWTININVIDDIESDWKSRFVHATDKNGKNVLKFTDKLPDYLKSPNKWQILWTNNPNRPNDQWEKIVSTGELLDEIEVPQMTRKQRYYIRVISPNYGIESSIFTVDTPSPPEILQIGSNLDLDTVIDFQPAISTEQIDNYEIEYWPVGEPDSKSRIETESDVTSGIVLPGLEPGTRYEVKVAAIFEQADLAMLESDSFTYSTPQSDIACECSQVCNYEEDKLLEPKCTCYKGFILADDMKNCVEQAEIKVDAPSIVEPEDAQQFVDTNSTLQTDADLIDTHASLLPTDETSMSIFPIVGPDGFPLPTDKDEELTYPISPLPTQESGKPVDSDASPLPTDKDEELTYPISPLPTQESGKPVDPDASPLPTDKNEELTYPISPLPTQESGKPVDPDASPLPTDKDEELTYPISPYSTIDNDTVTVSPVKICNKIDWKANLVFIAETSDAISEDELLSMKFLIESFIDNNVPLNEVSVALIGFGEKSAVTFSLGNYENLFDLKSRLKNLDKIGGIPEAGLALTTSLQLLREYHYHGVEEIVILLTKSPLTAEANLKLQRLKDNETITVIELMNKHLWMLLAENDGHEIINQICEKIANRLFIKTKETMAYSISPLPTAESGTLIYPVDSSPLTTYENKEAIYSDEKPPTTDKDEKSVVPNGSRLPTTDEDEKISSPSSPVPTNELGLPIYPVVGPNGSPLPTDDFGNAVGIDDEPLSTNEDGKPIGTDCAILPTDENNNFIYSVPVTEEDQLTTDETGKPLHHVIEPNGSPMPTIDHTTSFVPTDSYESSITTHRPSTHCYVNAQIDIILVIDASSNIRIIDYLYLKEVLKTFLRDNFDLSQHHVRIGLVIYGDTVEVPLPLGNYDNSDHLLDIFANIRRLKGDPMAGRALDEAMSDFMLSGNYAVPKFVILIINGKSIDNPKESADKIRTDFDATIFVINAGTDPNNEKQINDIVGGDLSRVIQIDEWRNANLKQLAPITDGICQIAPMLTPDSTVGEAWPIRKITVSRVGNDHVRACSRIDFPADLIVLVESSKNVNAEQFEKAIEAASMFIENSANLSPDLVRVGFITYSEDVAVPVALGNYEDKIELMEKVAESWHMNGEAVISMGLVAAIRQFEAHGRQDVPRALLLMTTGQTRGQPDLEARRLRDELGTTLITLVVGVSEANRSSITMTHIGVSPPNQMIFVDSWDDLTPERLASISAAMCTSLGLSLDDTSLVAQSRISRTTRNVAKIGITMPMMIPEQMLASSTVAVKSSQLHLPNPLCQDDIYRPYMFTFVVDVTKSAPELQFRAVLDMCKYFFHRRFLASSVRLRLNLVLVDGRGVQRIDEFIGVDNVDEYFDRIQQDGHGRSALLGAAIDQAVLVSNARSVPGSFPVIVVISANGRSSDDVMPSVEWAHNEWHHQMVAISIAHPLTELLAKMVGNRATRVIHFADWSDLMHRKTFDQWLALIICKGIVGVAKAAVNLDITATPATFHTVPNSSHNPTNVRTTAMSPTSVLISWTCCTNTNLMYQILYSVNLSIPKSHWTSVKASCRDSFGMVLSDLTTKNTYTFCVATLTSDGSQHVIDDNCRDVTLTRDSASVSSNVAQFDPECRCSCDDDGNGLLQPCFNGDFPPVTTLPPVTGEQCPCKVESHAGRCPLGFRLRNELCYDINECAVLNGDCSDGCVNTPGGHYCACPYGKVRDPTRMNRCISMNKSVDRVSQLLAQYLYSNLPDTSVTLVDNGSQSRRYKARLLKQDKDVKLEWSVPGFMKKSLKWLF